MFALSTGLEQLPGTSDGSLDADRLARAIGLGIEQVQVAGHRHTLDGDIFRALGLDQPGSQLSFDVAAARDRIEQLPWVQTATIQRTFPDGLVIAITERTPYAVWHRQDVAVLLDQTGRELAAIRASQDLGLPAVTGDGAGPRAAEILALVTEHEPIARRFLLAWRIADRRWMIELASGVRIELPAEGEAAALARMFAQTPPAALAALLDGAADSIDLRGAEHMVIRRHEPSQQHGETAAPLERFPLEMNRTVFLPSPLRGGAAGGGKPRAFRQTPLPTLTPPRVEPKARLRRDGEGNTGPHQPEDALAGRQIAPQFAPQIAPLAAAKPR